MKELEIKLYGKVQGVGLRKRIEQLALQGNHEIVGYVTNTDSGSVELVAQGLTSELEEFLTEVKEGTVHSEVNEVKVIWHDRVQDTFTAFEIW